MGAETTKADEASGPATAEQRREWLRRVLRRHEWALRRYLIRVSGTTEAGEAAVTAAFRKLWIAVPPPPEEKCAEWLYRAGREAALAESRRRRAAGDVAPPPAAAVGGPTAQAIARLGQVQQEVLRLKFDHGLHYREVGAVLNLTVPNVSALVHGALKQLRAEPAFGKTIDPAP